MRIGKLAFSVAVALGVAAPLLLAQQHRQTDTQGMDMAAMMCGAGGGGMMSGMMPPGRGMGMGGQEMMHGMMGPPAPAMILHHKDKLGLNASQVTRLEALQKEAEPVCMQHMKLAMTTHQAANQLLESAAPDFAAYSAKLKEATAHMVEGHVAMAKAAVAAREVLTTAQRQTLKDLMEQMHKKP
jgi:Spy/CpxP family protein refolding chaperone